MIEKSAIGPVVKFEAFVRRKDDLGLSTGRYLNKKKPSDLEKFEEWRNINQYNDEWSKEDIEEVDVTRQYGPEKLASL